VPQLRIALAQVDSTVGDLAGNAQTIIDWTGRAAARGADLVLFPEMMLTGYPVEDLALRASFVDASIAALDRTAARLAEEGLGGIAVVTGYLGRRTGQAPHTGEPVSAAQNAAALLRGGEVVVTTAKHHLPNYGVFDEYRYFVPGNRLPVVRVPCGDSTADVAIAICEDLWQDGGPVTVTRQAGAGLLVVPNASPYERGKDAERLELCVSRAAEAGATLAYVNMVGGQDRGPGRDAAGARPPVRRGADRRRPGPARRRPGPPAWRRARRCQGRHAHDDPPGGASGQAPGRGPGLRHGGRRG
jgi:NAD+ synthase (glutamine-hydrolysing)